MNSVESAEKIFGMEAAYILFKAIAYYSMYDVQPDFSGKEYLEILWAVIEREIDLSIGRRKKNFAKDDIDENVQKVKSALIQNPNASIREIARMTGVPKSKVDRIKHKYAQEIDLACAKTRVNAVSSDSDPVTDNDNGSDYGFANANDTMGRDRDGTVGQYEDVLSSLDRIQHRIIDSNIVKMEFYESPEHLGHAMSMRGKCRLAYKSWLKSISSEAVETILQKYLSTHKESPAMKRLGDQYGRIVGGWDNERNEPIIVYPLQGSFPPCTKHNISNIPVEYYMTPDQIEEIEDEEAVFLDWINEQDAEREHISEWKHFTVDDIDSETDDSMLPF